MILPILFIVVGLLLAFAVFVLLVPPGWVGIGEGEGPVEGWTGKPIGEEEWV